MKKDLSQFKYFKPKKLLLSSQKYGLVPESEKKLIPDPDFLKSTGSRIRNTG